MDCPNCGKPLKQGDAFCTHCGNSVPPEPQASSTCPSCGAPLAEDAAFCTACGAKRDESASDAASAPSAEATVRRCKSCGAVVDADARFCTECGATEFVEAAEAVETAKPAPTPAPAPAPASAPVASVIDEQAKTQALDSLAAPATTQVMPPVSQPATQSATNYVAPPVPQKNRSKKPMVIAIVVVVVILALVGGLAAYHFAGPGLPFLGKESSAKSSQSAAATSTTTSLDVTFTGEDYSAEFGTPVALEIKGTTTEESASFQETFYIDGTGKVEVPLGSYTATPLASPFNANGGMYGFDPTSIAFVVSATGSSEPLKWTLKPLAADALTPEVINAAGQAAIDGGVAQSDVDSLKQKAMALRDQASAQKDAQAKADAEAEAKKASNTWYVCASDFVTLRASKSTNATAIVRINVREPVTYIGDAGGGWSEVEYNGKRGYVLTRFISKDPNAPLDYGDV